MTEKARPTVTDALRAIYKKLDRLDTKIDVLPDAGLAASVASLAASFASLDTKVKLGNTKVDELQTGLITWRS